MSYTFDQLVKAYTTLHVGLAPNDAQSDSLRLVAGMSASGQLSDATVLTNLVNGVDSTTALAVLSYQFFTGKSPSAAGLTYLVNSSVNTADLNDPYYSKFSLENRYINFAANLGVQGEGAAAFSLKYGSMAYADYVASIYQTIVGSSYATAAGIDPAAAIASIISRKDAILATAQSAGMIPANATAAQIDIALKAATAGYLMGEAIKADVGLYAAATDNFMVAMLNGTAVYNTNIAITYAPNNDTVAHGTGHAVDRGLPSLPDPVTTPPVVTPSHIFTLTTGGDHITGTAQDDVFIATQATLITGDILDGGAGNDTLTVNATADFVLPGVTVTSIETLNLNSTVGIRGNTNTWAGLSTINVNAHGGSRTSIVAALTTDVNATVTNVGNAMVGVYEGHNITLAVTGVTGNNTSGGGYSNQGLVEVDNTSNGFIDVTRTSTNAGQAGTIYASGGSTIKVTQIAGNDVNTTQTNGVVSVGGGHYTTSVEVVSSNEATAGFSTAGVVANAVYVSDYYTTNPNTLGTLTTVKVNSYSSLSISDDVLSSLTLSNGHGDVTIDTQGMTIAGHATALTVGIKNVTSGTLNDFDNNYSTMSFVTDTTASTLTAITSTSLTTLNVSGNTSLTVGSLAGSTALHTATVTGTATLTATFGAGNDTISLGAGANNINVGSGTDTVTVRAADAHSNTVFTTLTGMGAGDRLWITPQGGAPAATSPMLGAAVTGGTSLQTYLDLASTANGHTAAIVKWFQYSGDTYVVLDSSANNHFDPGTDIVVKLTGLIDLTNSYANGTGMIGL